ncbi:MAG: bacteriocin fulvocin C-related protein, partial [Ferruginibacter sp.]
MKSTILTTLSAAVLFFFFSCNKQDVNNEKLSMNEDSNLKIAKAVSLISKVDRKLAFSMLSSSEKYILWVQHLENAKNNPNLTRQQKQLIDEAKQFISISFFEGNKSTKNKSFDIWKYRVSQHFN